MARPRAGVGRFAFNLTVGLIYLFLMLPIIIVVIASLNSGAYLKFPPDGLSLRWYKEFFTNGPFLNSAWLSIKVAVISTIISTIIGTLAALYYVKASERMQIGLRLGLISPILLPEILTAIALLLFYYMVGIGTTTLIGLQIGHVLITTPYVFLNVTATLEGINPSLQEAARSLGARPQMAFRRVTLPLMKQGVVNGAMFAFIISFDTFSISLLLKGIHSMTLPIQLFEYLRWSFDPTAAAVATLSILVTLAAVFITDRLVGLRTLRF
ncbi:ABC transporter permease [Acuticoccus kandeliae]|uniref:ABC transporter permease n=1 Tax=Acuticoccus kandeliae TaxID=2073160 RepID=UPI000D3E5A87|nr:ABC transporter permease [Acuticoccus kandeliae]